MAFYKGEIAVKRFLKICLLAGVILCLIVSSALAREYLILQSKADSQLMLSFRNDIDLALKNSGLEDPVVLQWLEHMRAARVDIDKEQVSRYKVENPNSLIIPADIKLYPSELPVSSQLPNEIAMPWHVSLAVELQEYSIGKGALYDKVRVFVLDSGINSQHEDLAASIEMDHALNFYGEDTSDITDEYGHGTKVSGVLAGTETGVCPFVKFIPLKVADIKGEISLGDLTEALDHVIGLSEKELTGKRIILNLSYNSEWFDVPDSGLENYYDITLSLLKEAGILMVSSAGNGDSDGGKNVDVGYVYPTSNESSNYIAAASINKEGSLSDFSHFGYTTVETAAPGSDIVTTGNEQEYETVWGTSFSSPFVCGIAATIWALEPSLECWEVRNLIINAVQGQKITRDFIDEYRGREDDFLFRMDSNDEKMLSSQKSALPVMSGKPLNPDTIANDPEKSVKKDVGSVTGGTSGGCSLHCFNSLILLLLFPLGYLIFRR